jgi:hypothetical protein
MKDKLKDCKKCQTKYPFQSTGCELCTDCVEKYPYFLSFIQERFVGISDTTFGRVEVYSNADPTAYAKDELRFIFKDSPQKLKAFQEFRDRWDFQHVNGQEFKEIKTIIKNNFYNN